jgi:ParB-like chromosome segregation protein Spo0J
MLEKRWRIDPALTHLIVPIDSLTPHPQNPNVGSSMPDIRASLLEFGQVRPIVCNKAGVIGAGNHVWFGAKELGATEIAAVLTELTDDELRAYMLADNRIPELRTGYDQERLAVVLTDLASKGRLEGTGYTPDFLDDLLVSMRGPQVLPPEAFRGGSAETPEQAAARAANMAATPGRALGLREVILMLRLADYADYDRAVQRLKVAWSLETGSEVVLRCVLAAERATISETPA